MKKHHVFILLCLAFALNAGAQQKIASGYLDRKGEVYFSFKVSEKSIVNKLTDVISLDAVHGNSATAYANKKEFSEFLKYNLTYTVLPHPGDALLAEMEKQKSESRATWDFYPTIDQYNTMMYDFEKKYPDLCKIYEIGTSVKGNKILFAKISKNLNARENEPQFMYSSSIHGDEVTGYVLTLRFIDYLLSNYGKIPRVTNLVDNIEIWINPLENPDGFVAGTRSNANNVDLNRNFKNPSGSTTLQKETKDFQAFLDSKYFVLESQFHGGVEAVMIPWGYKAALIPDNDWYFQMGHEYADTARIYGTSNYFNDGTNGVSRCADMYLANNTFVDYVNYYSHGRATFMEVSSTKTPSGSQLPNFWNYNYRSMLNFMEGCLFGIRGLVKDSVTGAPIRALVTVVNHDADSSQIYSTPDVGNYHRMIKPGTYTLKYSAPCYVDRVISNISVASYKSITYKNVKMVCKPTCSCFTGVENKSEKSSIQISPNPFNSSTKISCKLPYSGNLNVSIYDMYGRLVEKIQDGILSLGIYDFTWDATKYSKGVYSCVIKTENNVEINKIISQ
jgi:hypothetical protein